MATKNIKMKLPVALGSYCHLFEAWAFETDQKKKFGLALLWDKVKDKDAMAPLRKAIIEVATEKFGPTALAQFKAHKLKSPLRDGDIDRPEDEVFHGKVFANATSDRQPGIVDAKVQKIISEEEAFSGCFFRASVSIFAYEKAGNKGVGIGLNNLQVVAKGERIDGRTDATEDFKEFAEADGVEPSKAGAKDDDDLLG